MIAEKEKKGYTRSGGGGDDDDAVEAPKKKQRKAAADNDGAVSAEQVEALQKQLEDLTETLEAEDDIEGTWREVTADPLLLALGSYYGDDGDDITVLCPLSRLGKSFHASFPWTWKPNLQEFIETAWASFPNNEALIAHLKAAVREIVVLQAGGKWHLAYVMRAAATKLHACGVRRFEDYRTNISVAFGSAPASAESIEACKARLKAQDWIVDSTLIAAWRVHGTLGACNSTNGDEYVIGPYLEPMVHPDEFRLQSAIYDAKYEKFDPAEFAELFVDTG
jgi:hypothetical protein